MLLFRRASLLSLAAIAVLFTSFASSEPQLDRPADRERREVKPADPNPAEEWLQFNCDTIASELKRDNVAQLTKAWQSKLIDIADTTAVFVSKVPTIGGIGDILVVSTNSGDEYLSATIAAYPDPGDAGDYQGHLVAINLANGEQHVFNALCSDRDQHFSYDAAHDCSAQQAGVWARAGAIYDPVTDRAFVTTGNGAFDADQGRFNWGTSIVALHPDGTTDHGTPIDSYTPVDYDDLNRKDWDLSSTT